MVAVIRQVHGYRQGHQLLATSDALPKADQALVDRLSDVAGPLRPKERFEPYLSAYPLPTGDRYVLARTWQDTLVTRAGCVRTLSLIIPIESWARAKSPASFLPYLELDHLPTEGDAEVLQIDAERSVALPPTPSFRASELLEALFLEEAKPVAVFDAPSPELIAVRLLTALWPSMRRRFAISTFALSPRKIAGRDFDLVFAPKDARAKFTDWPGRRVDGRASPGARHKWTSNITTRVFDQPNPQLLTDRELDLVGNSENDADTAAALRIALLWDELAGKLESTPTAALGLLDIANSGMVRDTFALMAVEPGLTNAILQAPSQLAANEAWDFLGAIVRKMQGRPLVDGKRAVAQAVEALASQAPEGGVSFLNQPDLKGATADFVSAISDGIAKAPLDHAERAFMEAPDSVLGRLLAEGGALSARAATNPTMINRLGDILTKLDPSQFEAVRRQVLPHLADDWQLPVAKTLMASLDGPALAREATRLGQDGFRARQLSELVVTHARKTGHQTSVRAALIQLPPSTPRDNLVAMILSPVVEDVAWLIFTSGMPDAAVNRFVVDLLRNADDRELALLLSSRQVSGELLGRLSVNGVDILQRAIESGQLAIDVFVDCVAAAIPTAKPTDRDRIAEVALHRCLPARLNGDGIAFIAGLLGALGDRLSGPWAARTGVQRDLPAMIASRNVVAFQTAPTPARGKIVAAVGDLADALDARRSFDLDGSAIQACAQLMADAGETARPALLNAAGRLLPTLMRQTRYPVSPLVAVLFPAVYRELAKEDEVPDLLKIVPFFDWDRCKAARRELVSAFIASTWSPADLALTACRSGDVARILRRTARAYGGESYIDRISSHLGSLPPGCRRATETAISALKADWAAKYDWRD